MLNIVLVGASGKMGSAIFLEADPSIFNIIKINRQDNLGTINLKEIHGIMDVSTPASTMALLPYATQYNIPLLIGVTGYTKTQENTILQAATNIPVLFTSNFSLGVNLLFHLVSEASKFLPKDFIPSITERHHTQKKDHPSGTALSLAKIIQTVQNTEHFLDCSLNIKTTQKPNTLHIHSIREGKNNSEHSVSFQNVDNEILNLSYHSQNRKSLAIGALKAISWLAKQKKPGLYSMLNVLSLPNLD